MASPNDKKIDGDLEKGTASAESSLYSTDIEIMISVSTLSHGAGVPSGLSFYISRPGDGNLDIAPLRLKTDMEECQDKQLSVVEEEVKHPQ